jgi:hypothetical protein
VSYASVTKADDVTHTVVRHGESQDDVTSDVGYSLFKNESLEEYFIGF